MRYTVLIDDPDLPRVHTVGADTITQAVDELHDHMRSFPDSIAVFAEVGEPGDETPHAVLVATRTRAGDVLVQTAIQD